MQKLLLGALALVVITMLCGYGLWTEQRPAGHYLSDLRVELTLNQGIPANQGNLLGIEPELFPGDYQSLQRLHLKLAAYLQHAREQGLISRKTVVILPEHIGTWLWALGEKSEMYQVTHLDQARQWLELSNPLRYGLAMLGATGDDRRADAHLRMKAAQMASDYQQLFGGLAREFDITLVAGSIVLPEPYVDGGTLRVGSGALYNSSLVFANDGSILGQPVRQKHPDNGVRRFIHAGAHPLQVLETPAGRLGVLVGSDSWYPDNYRQLEQHAVQVIANPAFIGVKHGWRAPWRGNRHQPLATQLPLKPGEVSEGEAWQRLILANKDREQASMSVFLQGRFWEVSADGEGFASRNGQNFSVSAKPGARLLNLWL